MIYVEVTPAIILRFIIKLLWKMGVSSSGLLSNVVKECKALLAMRPTRGRVYIYTVRRGALLELDCCEAKALSIHTV